MELASKNTETIIAFCMDRNLCPLNDCQKLVTFNTVPVRSRQSQIESQCAIGGVIGDHPGDLKISSNCGPLHAGAIRSALSSHGSEGRRRQIGAHDVQSRPPHLSPVGRDWRRRPRRVGIVRGRSGWARHGISSGPRETQLAKRIGAMTMTAILRAFTLATALLLVTVAASRAADQTVALRIGVKSTLVLDRAFDTVLIGDSDIVDVHERDDRSVVLHPLGPGTTNLIFVDGQQIVIANIEVLVRQPAINLVGRLP
jgi:hypothetical protein